MGLPPISCAECDYPGLLTANLDAWELYHEAHQVLFDGLGGVNLGNVRQVADGLGLDWDHELVRKLLAILDTVKENGDAGPGDD